MELLVSDVLKPLARRTGTAVGVWLVAQGYEDGLAAHVVTGVTAFLLVGIDLVASRLNRSGVR